MDRIDHTPYLVREKIGRLLSPRLCVLCRMESPGRYICSGCEVDLPWLDVACPGCAEPLPQRLAEGVTCAACQQRPPVFDRALAPLRYAFPVDCALKALKFNRRLYYAQAFAAILLPHVFAMRDAIDTLMPVPLHHSRHAMRGFNQATEICRSIALATGLPIDTSVVRTRNTPAQAGLDLETRRRNLHGAFRARKKIRGQRPLIIDDVMTTGETCSQLAAALKQAGATRISVIAIARASVRQTSASP